MINQTESEQKTKLIPVPQVNWLSSNPTHTIARAMPSGMQYNLTKDQWQTVLSNDDLNWFLTGPRARLFEIKIKNKNFTEKTWFSHKNLYAKLLKFAYENKIAFYDSDSEETFYKLFSAEKNG
jgi:hypothetical protein